MNERRRDAGPAQRCDFSREDRTLPFLGLLLPRGLPSPRAQGPCPPAPLGRSSCTSLTATTALPHGLPGAGL